MKKYMLVAVTGLICACTDHRDRQIEEGYEHVQRIFNNVGIALSLNLPDKFNEDSDQTEREFERILPIGSSMAKVKEAFSKLENLEDVEIQQELDNEENRIFCTVRMGEKSGWLWFSVYFVLNSNEELVSIGSVVSSIGTVGDYKT